MYNTDQQIKNRRTILIGGVIAFVILVIISIGLYINSLRYSGVIDILIAPSFATVTIDDKTYPSSGIQKLLPGTYTATISAEDFTTKTITFTVTSDEPAVLYEYLVPSNGSMDWYVQHPSEDMILTTIGNYNSNKAADDYYIKYPISTVLPIVVVEVNPETYDWTEYRIDGSTDFEQCKTDYCVKITDTTGGNYENALKKIRENGFNPDDYEIIYDYVPIEPLE